MQTTGSSGATGDAHFAPLNPVPGRFAENAAHVGQCVPGLAEAPEPLSGTPIVAR